VLVVGAVQESAALPLLDWALTWMLNAGKEADTCPSLTLTTMFENVPTLELDGVPLTVPVAMLKVAQEGRFWTLKLSVRPDGPLAVGVKEYACPAVTEVAGVPLIVGGTVLTWMLNAGNEADAWPSLTLITMFEKVPTLELEGVPLRVPVDVLNAAQVGRFWTLKVSVEPDGPAAVGVKLYVCPSLTEVVGVPLMVGGGGGADAVTWMLNACNEADAWPSLTLITMFENVPIFELDGVPLRAPVEVLRVAHGGRFCALKLSVIPDGPLAVGVKE